MGRLVEFDIGRTTFVAELLEKEAPKTCNALWNALPLESDTHHAKFAGEELFFSFPYVIQGSEDIENLVYVYDLEPGEISFTGNGMVICYGAMEHERYPTNLTMRVIESTMDPFKEACRRAFRNPGEKVKIRRKI